MSDTILVDALKTAFQNAVISLRKNHNEDFYYYAYIFDEGIAYISAWSYEAYEKSVVDNNVSDEDKRWWKWDYSDSPYAVYGYDEYFTDVCRILNERDERITDDELESEWNTRISAMEKALKQLDEEGFFSDGEKRSKIIINVEAAPPDCREHERAVRLNPPSPLLDEYLKFCETEEDDDSDNIDNDEYDPNYAANIIANIMMKNTSNENDPEKKASLVEEIMKKKKLR